MRVLVVTSRFPYPLEKGDKLRIFHLIRQLSKNHEVDLFALTEGHIPAKDLAQVSQLVDQVHVFRINRMICLIRVALSLLGNKPAQVAYYDSKRAKRNLSGIIRKCNYDMVFGHLLRVEEFVKSFEGARVMDVMDAFSVIAEGRSKSAPHWQRWFWKREAQKMRAREKKVPSMYDLAFVISEVERERLGLQGQSRIEVLKNGVDDFEYCEGQFDNTNDLVFVGNMRYYPNKKAADYLLTEVMPRLNKGEKRYTLKLAGSGAAQVFDASYPSYVAIADWVDDIREHYLSARIMIAPIFEGSGMQNKILEALSLGVPCVTTSKVAKSFSSLSTVLRVSDDAQRMCEEVVELLENDQRYKDLSQRGRFLVEEHFSWDEVGRELNQYLEQIIK